MKIRISDIPTKGLSVNEQVALSEIDFQEVGLRICSPVEVVASIEKLEDKVIIKGSYRIPFKALCCRCCEEFDYKLDKPFEFEYKVDSKKDIDMKFVISEDILLSLPPKILCKADCKGLCAICGQNLNVDNCRHQSEQ